MKPFREDEFDQMFKDRLANYERQPETSFWLKIKRRLANSTGRQRYLILLLFFFVSTAGAVGYWWMDGISFSRSIAKMPLNEGSIAQNELIDTSPKSSLIDLKDKAKDEQLGVKKMTLSQLRFEDIKREDILSKLRIEKSQLGKMDKSLTFDANSKDELKAIAKLLNPPITSLNIIIPDRISTLSVSPLDTTTETKTKNHFNFRLRPQIFMNYLNIQPNNTDEFYTYNFVGRKPLTIDRLGLQLNGEATYLISERLSLFGGINGTFQNIRFNYTLQDPYASYFVLRAQGNSQLEIVPVYQDTVVNISNYLVSFGGLLGVEYVFHQRAEHQHSAGLSLDWPLLSVQRDKTIRVSTPMHINLMYTLQKGASWNIQPFARLPLKRFQSNNLLNIYSYQIGVGFEWGLK